MFQFVRNRLLYSQLRKELIQKAQLKCEQLYSPADDILVKAFRQARLEQIDGTLIGRKRTNIRTPLALKPLLEIMLDLPPELSAWLVFYRIGKAISVLGLPIEVQGDIMMAFECGNFVLPEKTSNAARHLAHALCLMPSLGRARTTLHNLGCPWDDRKMSEEEMDQLVRQGCLPQDVMVSSNGLIRLGWNVEMREAVVGEIQKIHPDLRHLLQFDRMQEKERAALRRWETMPNQEAAGLLQKGIEVARMGHFEEALELLDKAGNSDPALLPDVFRNKAWILSKQKHYEECADLCRQALNIDSEYAEVWYQLGICLAKSMRYSEALKAYEKAKLLGFRSSGLEPNMETCRRAISNDAMEDEEMKKAKFKCLNCRLVFSDWYLADPECPNCGLSTFVRKSNSGVWIVWLLVLLAIAFGAWFFWAH